MTTFFKDLLTKTVGETWYRAEAIYELSKSQEHSKKRTVTDPDKVMFLALVGFTAFDKTKLLVPTGLFGITRISLDQKDHLPSQENPMFVAQATRGFTAGLFSNAFQQVIQIPTGVAYLQKTLENGKTPPVPSLIKGIKVLASNNALRQEVIESFFIRMGSSSVLGAVNGALVSIVSTIALEYLKK